MTPMSAAATHVTALCIAASAPVRAAIGRRFAAVSKKLAVPPMYDAVNAPVQTMIGTAAAVAAAAVSINNRCAAKLHNPPATEPIAPNANAISTAGSSCCRTDSLPLPPPLLLLLPPPLLLPPLADTNAVAEAAGTAAGAGCVGVEERIDKKRDAGSSTCHAASAAASVSSTRTAPGRTVANNEHSRNAQSVLSTSISR